MEPPWDGWWVLTVADDPAQGVPLEVELNVHVFALGEEVGSGKGTLGQTGSSTPHTPIPSVLPAPSGPTQPQQGPTLLPRSLTNREELSFRTVLAFPKAAGEDGGYGGSGGCTQPWQVWDARAKAQDVGHSPSSTGLDCRSCSFTLFTSSPLLLTAAT